MTEEEEKQFILETGMTPERLARAKAFKPVTELRASVVPPPLRFCIRITPNKNIQIANLLVALSEFMVMGPRLVFNYLYDGADKLVHLLVQIMIVAQTSDGKSFSGWLRKLILAPILLRDRMEEEKELAHAEERKNTGQSKDKPKEPITVKICLMKFTKNKIVKRAHMMYRKYGDYLTFSIFTDELSTLVERRGSYGDLRDFGKLAYDWGSETSVDTNSDASYNATVDINWVSVYNTTPAILYKYLDKDAIESGNANRMTFITLGDMLGVSNPPYLPLTKKELTLIKEWQQKLMDATYLSDNELQPLHEIPMTWLHEAEELWCDVQRLEIRTTLSAARNAFYKRASASAARFSAMLFYLWGENPRLRNKVKEFYFFVADYILKGQLMLFEQIYEKHMIQLDYATNKKPSLYELMPQEFSRDQLAAKMTDLGRGSEPRQYICNWKRDRLIEELPDQKDVFKKI